MNKTIDITLQGIDMQLRTSVATDSSYIKSTVFHWLNKVSNRARVPTMIAALRLLADFIHSFSAATVACSVTEPGLIHGFCLHIAGAPFFFYVNKDLQGIGLVRALNEYTRELGRNGDLFNETVAQILPREARKDRTIRPDVYSKRPASLRPDDHTVRERSEQTSKGSS